MNTPDLTITPPALAAVREIIQERQLTDHALRVYVQDSGCCSTRQYGLALDPNVHEQDAVLEIEGLRITVDPVSLDYLQGAVIDFVDGPQGRGFAIQAATYCGCGHDHDHAEEAGGGCGCGHDH